MLKNTPLNSETLTLNNDLFYGKYLFPEKTAQGSTALESFEYFDVSNLKNQVYDIFPSSENSVLNTQELKEALKPHHDFKEWDLLLFYNQTLILDFASSELQKALEIKKNPDFLTANNQENEPCDYFQALPLRLSNTKIHLHISNSLKKDIHIIFLSKPSQKARITYPLVDIHLPKNARKTFFYSTLKETSRSSGLLGSPPLFMEEFKKDLALPFFTVYLESGAHLYWNILMKHPSEQEHFLYLKIIQKAESESYFNWIHLKAGKSRIYFESTLLEAGAKCFIDGGYSVDDKEKTQWVSRIYHQKNNTESRQLMKGFLGAGALFSVDSDIIVSPMASDVEAYQLSKTILLNKSARAFACPKIHVSHDKLKCSHGASIGKVDPTTLLYLQRRGLTQKEAVSIISTSILDEILNYCSNNFWKNILKQLY